MCGNGNLIVNWINYLFLWRPVGGERTVKKLRLSKALTIPEGTTVSDACRRMTARRVNAALLTDANALLSGIVTDKVRFCLYC
jgi:CBS domain containing-hemolysin-like protein